MLDDDDDDDDDNDFNLQCGEEMVEDEEDDNDSITSDAMGAFLNGNKITTSSHAGHRL